MRGAHLGDGVFAIAEIIAAFLWLFHRKRGQEESAKAAEDKVKKWARIIFLTLFSFTTLLYAPYAKYKEAQSQAGGEARHDIPYDLLTNQLSELKIKAIEEAKRADQEHENLEEERKRSRDYQVRYAEAISATNSHATSEALTNEIAILKNDESHLSPTNPDNFAQIYQNRRLEGLLETKQRRLDEITALKNAFAPAYPLWAMVVTTFQTKLNDYAKFCGGKANPVTFPTLDDIVSTAQFLNFTIGTNVSWSCRCRIGISDRGADMAFDIKGQRAPAKLYFWVGPPNWQKVQISLTSDEITFISTNCLVASKSDFANLMNYTLEYLMQSQKAEFEPLAK